MQEQLFASLPAGHGHGAAEWNPKMALEARHFADETLTRQGKEPERLATPGKFGSSPEAFVLPQEVDPANSPANKSGFCLKSPISPSAPAPVQLATGSLKHSSCASKEPLPLL